MLLPADVVPFLLHEDAGVREHALEYLAQGHDPAPATADEVWAAMDRYGDTPSRYNGSERARFAAELAHFPPTPRSTERLFHALRGDATQEVGAQLLRTCLELPPDTLRALLADEAVRARLPESMIAEIYADLTLAETSFDALWTALSSAAAELGDRWQLDAPVYRRARHLVRAISRSPEQAAARGVESLGDGGALTPTQANMQVFAVEIFGRVRYPGPLDALMRVFSDGDGYLNERVTDALVHVGTPEVVAAVAAALPGTEPLLTYAPGAIARIRRPESEAALIRLLGAEEDPGRRTELAMYLLELCTTSTEALGIIEKMVEDGEYDPLMVELDELLVKAGKMVGWSPRDPGAWEARPKMVRPTKALERALQRMTAQTPSPTPSRPQPARRGFVPFGKKAQKKKARERR